MKKIFLSLLLTVCCALVTMAAEPTGKALTFRGQAKSYLQSEGYMPQIDSDGDLQFKSGGRTLYIRFNNYGPGVYMDMFFMLGIEDSSMNKVRRAADDAQKSLKFVRVDILNEEALTIDVVQYLSNFEDFKENCAEYIDIILTCRQRFLDNYNE